MPRNSDSNACGDRVEQEPRRMKGKPSRTLYYVANPYHIMPKFGTLPIPILVFTTN